MLRNQTLLACISTIAFVTKLHAQAMLFEIPGAQSQQRLGLYVGFIGDTDGDGFSEAIFTGADPFQTTHPRPQQVFVAASRTGSTSLLALVGTPASVFVDVDRDGDGVRELGVAGNQFPSANFRVISPVTGAVFFTGTQSACEPFLESAGDTNADNVVDLLAGGCGVYRVHSGTGNGILLTFSGNGEYFWAARAVGDVNLDGRADIALGVDTGSAGNGATHHVRVVSGGSGSTLFVVPSPGELPFAGIGDVNLDGRPDLCVGRTVYTSPDGIEVFTLPGSAQSSDRIRGAGDLDGDGFADILIGNPQDGSGGSFAGAVRAYSGANGTLLSVLIGTPGSLVGESFDGRGDSNGDGFDDLVVGAPGYLVGSVVAAGKVLMMSGSVSPPIGYCTAKVNSLGCRPYVWATGSPSVSGPDQLHVQAARVLNNKSGIMFWGRQPNAVPFVGGTLCVSAPFVRTPTMNSGGSAVGSDCSGSYSFPFSHAYMQQNGLNIGTSVYSQFWYRDPGFAPPANVGLTDGVFFTVTF